MGLAFKRLDHEQPAFSRRPRRWRGGAFLDQSIPFAAGVAAARPAPVSGAAVLADVILCARRHWGTLNSRIGIKPAIDKMATHPESRKDLIADCSGGGGEIVDGDSSADE